MYGPPGTGKSSLIALHLTLMNQNAVVVQQIDADHVCGLQEKYGSVVIVCVGADTVDMFCALTLCTQRLARFVLISDTRLNVTELSHDALVEMHFSVPTLRGSALRHAALFEKARDVGLIRFE